MKKILLILTVLSLAFRVSCQEAEEPIVIAAPDTTIDKQAYELSAEGVTLSVSYGSAYPAEHAWNNLGRTYFACLANGSVTFSADKNIKGIAVNGWVKKNFSASCDKGTLNYLSDASEDTTGEPVLTISDINSNAVTLLCNNQLRCFSVEFYFTQNPGDIAGEVVDTVRFTAVQAEAADYSEDMTYSSEGHYSYWLKLAPAEGYPQVWLDLYSAVKDDLSGEYSLYKYNVGDYSYVQLSANELDYEYAYDQAFTITKSGEKYHIEGWIIAENDVQYEFVYDGSILFVKEEEEEEEGVESIQSSAVRNQKVLRNGELYIIQNERVYTSTGVEIR